MQLAGALVQNMDEHLIADRVGGIGCDGVGCFLPGMERDAVNPQHVFASALPCVFYICDFYALDTIFRHFVRIRLPVFVTGEGLDQFPIYP